jgi:tetratricopeptide (TPR) repeat protein
MLTYQVVQQTKLKDALNLAVNMRSEGRSADALSYMLSVQSFFDDEPLYLRRFLNGLGITYFDLHDHERACAEYRKALVIPAETDEQEIEQAVVKANLSNSLLELNEIEEAHRLLNEAEMIYRAAKEEAWLGNALEIRARVYLKEGKPEKARAAAKESLDLLWYGFDSRAREEAAKTLVVSVIACGAH